MIVGSEATDRPVEVVTRFDQFPATMKGAFVMRGADGNPHAVELQSVAVERIPTGPSKSVSMGEVHVNVAPNRDLYVPFEVNITDLAPGWYVIRSAARVDAGRTWTFASRGFVVPWPKDLVRRGTVRAGGRVRAGDAQVEIESVEMRADSAVVTVVLPQESTPAAGGAATIVRLLADGVDVEPVPAEARPPAAKLEAGGRARTTFYPVPRRTGVLSVLVRSGTAWSEPLELELS
jgi:hypothetical protein